MVSRGTLGVIVARDPVSNPSYCSIYVQLTCTTTIIRVVIARIEYILLCSVSSVSVRATKTRDTFHPYLGYSNVFYRLTIFEYLDVSSKI